MKTSKKIKKSEKKEFDIKKDVKKERIKRNHDFQKIKVLKSFWLSGVFYGAGSIIEVTPERAALLLSKPHAFERA